LGQQVLEQTFDPERIEKEQGRLVSDVLREIVDTLDQGAASDDSDFAFGERTHDLLKARATDRILLDGQNPHHTMAIMLKRLGELGGDQRRTGISFSVGPFSRESIHEPDLATELPELRSPCTYVLTQNEVLQQGVVLELIEVTISGSAHTKPSLVWTQVPMYLRYIFGKRSDWRKASVKLTERTGDP
jgi:hypothetical protein